MMGNLEGIGDDLWVMDGPTALDFLVLPYQTRMTITRLDDGGLWIASPVPCSYEDLCKVTALGSVRHLLSPTPRHRWRLESWHTLFPAAALWSCKVGPATLGRRTLPAGLLSDVAPPAWAGQLDQVRYPGRGFEETTFHHRKSGTLLLEDIVQAHPRQENPLLNALVRFGGLGGEGGVPRDIRALTRTVEARLWAERVLSWDFDQLVIAHGPIIRSGAKARVTRAFDWLLS